MHKLPVYYRVQLDEDTVEFIGEYSLENVQALYPNTVIEEGTLGPHDPVTQVCIGDEVIWIDPEHGQYTGRYKVVDIEGGKIISWDTKITIKNGMGYTFDVYPEELKNGERDYGQE